MASYSGCTFSGARRIVKGLSKVLLTVPKAAGVREYSPLRLIRHRLFLIGLACSVSGAGDLESLKLKVERLLPVPATQATYILFKDFFQAKWRTHYCKYIGGKKCLKLLEPIPLFRALPKCQDRALLITPFERLIYQANNGETARGLTTITKDGSRILIWGQDFGREQFVTLFDGILVDLHGPISAGVACPSFLVTVKNDRFKKGMGYSLLIHNPKVDRYELSGVEVEPYMIAWVK